MKVLYATMMATSLATGVAAACEPPVNVSDEGSGQSLNFITKELSWSDGMSITTFTAYGPPEQVNALDPENGLIECPDCELASSIEFGLGDEATSD